MNWSTHETGRGHRRSSLKSLIRNSSTSKSATCHQSRQADYRINALFSQEELRNAFRPYRSVWWTPKSRPLFSCNKLISDEIGFGFSVLLLSLIKNICRRRGCGFSTAHLPARFVLLFKLTPHR